MTTKCRNERCWLARGQSPGCHREGPLLRPLPPWRQRSGGLTMDQPTSHKYSYHEPVMVPEVLSLLEPCANGWIADCTYGGGGHSRALLDRFPKVRIIGLDRDPDSIARSQTHERLTVLQGNYRNLADVLGSSSLPYRVDGIFCDLGVSSHQLDTADRGFSYHRDAPLDMRMGPDADTSAAEIVNTADERALEMIFRRYGEERYARRIAAAIVQNRPFTHTVSLASCIADSVPAAARRSGHPARKVFQAIRISVNDELSALSEFMDSLLGNLTSRGRIVMLAYHSLEDRIVKRSFQDRARRCTCPTEIPVCVCDTTPELRLLTPKALRPSPEEIERNPRSRSAVLRAGERIS